MLDVKKLLKKAVKRKIRITDALIVGFLISGNLLYAEDLTNDKVISKQNENGYNLEKDDTNIINNGIISGFSDTFGKSFKLGNGVYSNNLNIANITNNGIISGYSTHSEVEDHSFGLGNGIYVANTNYSKINSINNNGVISGFYLYSNTGSGGNPYELGNGIYVGNNGIVGNSTINDITNTGVISGFFINFNNSGSSSGSSGNAIISVSAQKSISNIGNINNQGIIRGYSSIRGDVTGDTGNEFTGSGILSNGDSGSNVGNINNNGVISGFSTTVSSSEVNLVNADARQNGITSYSSYGSNNKGSVIGDISNKGIISSSAFSDDDGVIIRETGNGIYSYAQAGDSFIGDINNNGVISGFSSIHESGSGNGIYNSSQDNEATIGTVTNNGIIKGSQNAIYSKSINSPTYNYGILAGQTTIKTDETTTYINNYNNYGTEVIIGTDGNIQQVNTGTLQSGATNDYIVFNGSTDGNISNDKRYNNNTYISPINTYIFSSELVDENKDKIIINGVGTNNTGALIVNESISLSNSIINGYETALYVQNDKSFTGTDVIFNGGGLKNDIAVIKGDGGANTLNISGNSIINGAVDLGAGNDTLTLDNSVQINGTLTGGTGDDTLNLGLKNSTSSLSIYQDISDFESVNTNGNITVYETADIIGANVNIQSGNLTLRIDPTLKDDDGFITGHAFYQEAIAALDSLDKVASSSPTITSTGGYLVLGLNGLGESSTINMGGYTLIPDIDDKWWKPSDYLTTDSLVLDAKLKDDGNILVTVKESIPLEPPIDPEDPEPPVNPSIDPELYAELNKVYQSIVNTGEIGVLANTTLLEGKTYEEALEALLSILDQIHANNPYAYTLKSSRDSLKLFEDNLSYLTIKPKENEWIVQGKGFYSGVKNDNSKSSEGCYKFNKAYRNYETKTSFSGGLATAEYGLTNDSSVGFVLGGGHQSTDFKGSSKIKGNSLYLGAFAKKEINQFKFMSGIGYQYGSLKGERVVTNKYNYFKTDDRYDVNSFNVFVETKYDYALNNDWTLSPKAKLSWYYVSQDSVNEGYEPGNLSLKVDSATGNTGDLEIGFDLKNTLALTSGKLSNILSLGLINTIGDREKDLTGNILGAQKNGNSFDIRGIELPRTSGKLSYNLEYEKTNGMIYTLGLGYEFAKDNNKNVTATVGLGYKF